MCVPVPDRSVLDICTELVRSLGLRFGEVTIQATGGTVLIVRHGTTLRPEDLAEMPALPEGADPT